MKKVIVTAIALTAIGVAVRANRNNRKIEIEPLTIGAKDSYPQWVQDKFFVN